MNPDSITLAEFEAVNDAALEWIAHQFPGVTSFTTAEMVIAYLVGRKSGVETAQEIVREVAGHA